MKQLREAVRTVLAKDLGPVPDAPPLSIMTNGKLCTGKVRAATAWVLDREGGPRAANDLATRLLELYGAHDASSPVAESFEEKAVEGMDAQVAASRVRAALTSQEIEVVGFRRHGLGFRCIATALGTAPSTAHARWSSAATKLRSTLKSFSAGSAATALALAAS